MKTAADSSKKYSERASAASSDYVNGAKGSGQKWQQAAKAAAENHKQAVIAAANAGRYEKGIAAASAADYENGVETKGGARYSEGVSAGRSKYEQNSAKFDSARKAADSKPRGPRGSATNLERVKLVTEALRKAKIGQ